MNEFTLTKQISKQGSQAMILIPSVLKNQLTPGTIVEVKIKIIGEANDR